MLLVDVPSGLERLVSQLLSDLQSVQKKGRSVEETMIVEDTPMEAMHGVTGWLEDAIPAGVRLEEQVSSPRIPSFKDTLLGDSGISKQIQYLEELDVETRSTKKGIPKTYMGSQFEVLEEEAAATEKGRAVAESDTIPGEDEVVIVNSIIENGRLEVNNGGSHARGTVVEGGLIERIKGPVMNDNGSMSGEGEGTSKERTTQLQGTVASHGKVVPGMTTLDNRKHSVVRVEHAVDNNKIKSAKGRVLPSSIRISVS
ncbi:hypothetical protein V6N12_045132 [Hibiscus sabdariffa]|uniref:Uncharacterized protein n=1 Tax=Hibiscus sabdariffa TaxID=183260 RepID=A0ABR2G237_9ROSI